MMDDVNMTVKEAGNKDNEWFLSVNKKSTRLIEKTGTPGTQTFSMSFFLPLSVKPNFTHFSIFLFSLHFS